MTRLLFGPAAVLVVCAACGGSNAPPPDTNAVAQPQAEAPAASPAGPAATMAAPDAPATVGPSVTPGGAAPPPPPPPLGAGVTPLRDSAFGPRFKVDSTGKVIPIKRP